MTDVFRKTVAGVASLFVAFATATCSKASPEPKAGPAKSALIGEITPVVSVKELMETYIKYPPRPLQSEGYSGPITITNFQRLESVREQLKKQGFTLNLGGQ